MAYELIKVSELPELTTPSDPNVLPIQDGDYLKRISFENLKDAAVGDIEGSLAAAYDSTATYAVGDYCIYEGQLYRCTTAISTAEAWTAGHWTAAVLTDEIASDLSAEALTRSTNDNALAADIAEALGDLAAVYSTSATYAVGDYCIYQGQLYRCTTAITTAEAWTSGHWSAVALGNDTRDLKSALTSETEAREAADETLEASIEEIVDESLNDKADIVVNTASGAIANFPDGAAMPVKGLTVNIDPVQSGSGDPSPTNVRPITGWDAVKVTRTGKNLLDMSTLRAGNFDTASSFPDTSIVTDGYLPIKGGKTYALSQKVYPSGSFGRYVQWYDETKQLIGQENIYTKVTAIITAPDNACYVRVRWYNADVYSSVAGVADNDTQLEFGSSATDYEPYNGQTVTVQLGQTVYGGTLDVNTGVLTVDRITFNMTSIRTFTEIGDGGKRITFTIPQMANSYRVTENGLISNRYKGSNYTSELNNSVFMSNTSVMGISSSEVIGTSNAEIIAYFAANDTVMSYKVASPATYQLTPQEVSTVLGQNNIFADSGDVTVEYGADTKIYIEDSIVIPSLAMIAPIENGTTASQAYTAGQYFLHNNVFCKAIASIASGATFTLNTNYTVTTIAAELYTALH